jgi:hypothetical protein
METRKINWVEFFNIIDEWTNEEIIPNVKVWTKKEKIEGDISICKHVRVETPNARPSYICINNEKCVSLCQIIELEHKNIHYIIDWSENNLY